MGSPYNYSCDEFYHQDLVYGGSTLYVNVFIMVQSMTGKYTRWLVSNSSGTGKHPVDHVTFNTDTGELQVVETQLLKYFSFAFLRYIKHRESSRVLEVFTFKGHVLMSTRRFSDSYKRITSPLALRYDSGTILNIIKLSLLFR